MTANDTTISSTEAEPAERTSTAPVGRIDDWAQGSMKMATVDGHRVMVARTAEGFHAVDNACPHQGYGLATGTLDGTLVTCQWHNWKFDVTSGRCVLGEEDVPCHRVDLVDGEVLVSVTRPTDAERQARLWPSLRRGLEAEYIGQVARDSVRLLGTGAGPADIMWSAMEIGAPRAEYGVGHELAMAADCLAMAEIRHGDERALPLVQGLSGIAEVTRGRPIAPTPTPDRSVRFGAAVEAEDVDGAMAAVLRALDADERPEVIRHRFIEAASAHHLSYGHGMIYTQKTFEILDRVGWDRAAGVLPHLAARLVNSTREDTLPYMRKAMKRLAELDLEALVGAPADRQWSADQLVDTMLAATEAPIDAAAAAIADGAGVEGLLNAVSLGASRRLLRHDLTIELDAAEPFGWLDITHVLTTAQAARWAWRTDPGPHTVRAALFAAWLLFDSGRSERRHGVAERPSWIREAERGELDVDGTGAEPGSAESDHLAEALRFGEARPAVALAISGDPAVVGETLAEASLADRAGSFIVMAHLIKTTEAARRERIETGSRLPLAAAARFLASPRVERFVSRNVEESIDFVTAGRPPRR